MSGIAVADPAFSSFLNNCSYSLRVRDPVSSSFLPSSPFLPSPFPKLNGRCFHRPLNSTFPKGRQFLQVKATVGYPASISWWKKGHYSNMQEISSSDQFYDALGTAARLEKLVLVDFYSAGCRSCKALYPKICQLAAENPDIEILMVNFYDNIAFCRSLNVNVLPFFHFYRGSEGRIDAFSCSLSKIDKLRAAVAKYQVDSRNLTINISSSCISEPSKKLAVIPTLASMGAAA